MEFLTQTRSARGVYGATPSITISGKTAHISVSQLVIDKLGLDENKFNIAIDGTDIYLYINNDNGFKVNPTTRAFSSRYLASTIAKTLGIAEDEKFKLDVELESTESDGTEVWSVARQEVKESSNEVAEDSREETISDEAQEANDLEEVAEENDVPVFLNS